MKLPKVLFMLSLGACFSLQGSYYRMPDERYWWALQMSQPQQKPSVKQTPPTQIKNNITKKSLVWSPQQKAWKVRKPKDKK